MRSILDPLSSSLHNLQASVVVVGVPSGPKAGARMWTGSSLVRAQTEMDIFRADLFGGLNCSLLFVQMTLNDVCRKEGVPFYAMGSQGLGGWAFNDLGDAHEYVVERPDVNLAIPKTAVESAARHTAENGALASTNGFSSATHATTAPSGKRLEKRKQAFVPLRTAAAHSWTGLSRAQLRRSKPVPGLVAILGTLRAHTDRLGTLGAHACSCFSRTSLRSYQLCGDCLTSQTRRRSRLLHSRKACARSPLSVVSTKSSCLLGSHLERRLRASLTTSFRWP